MAQNKAKQWIALDRALPSRRKFLREGVALGSATLLGGAFSGARGDGIGQGQAGASPYREPPPYVPQWSSAVEPVAGRTGRRTPIRPTLGIRGERHPASDSGIDPDRPFLGLFCAAPGPYGIITPNGLHFERHHAGFPTVNPADHRLLIHGSVRRQLILTMDELMRFPSASRIHFIECGANSGMEWGQPTQISVQFTHGMLSLL
jgi:sulfane dehydrogenase subunit SoxC